jgi:histidinol dehydrogenase
MTAVTPALLGQPLEWSTASDEERAAWIDGLRPSATDVDVAPILEAVRRDGDAAVRELTNRFDGVDLSDPWVDPAALDAAVEEIPAALREALEASIGAVRRFHADQRDALRAERVVTTLPGVVAWRRWVPLERVGAYVPGGRAPLASSVIMVGVPARLAGVDDFILATPPGRDGRVAPAILAAARLVGIDRVLRIGGAQAIAALAYGTGTIPRVDRIVGAGNAWVTAAKRAVAADVDIDLPAGPSEALLVADATADPDFVALDLLAQAEHGPDSVAVLVTNDPSLVDAVEARLPGLAADLATGGAALDTLRAHGGAIVVASVDEAVAVADAVAPEHLSLQCAGADELASRVRHVGSVFIGPWSAIAGGDYATGTNHVLPTGGSARAYGGLGVETFGRWIEVQRLEPAGATGIADTVDALGLAEGLPAHARSVRARAKRAATAAATPDDPIALLRSPAPVEAYPAEPSNEDLSETLSLDADRIARLDLNTLNAGPNAEYGDMAYRGLRAAIAEASGAAPHRIIPGAGADELIRLATTQTVGPGDAVVIPLPTFAMFAVEARLAGARVVAVEREDLGIRQSVESIRDAAETASARLVWLCSPNNPTGDAYTLDEIERLASGLSALVVVDEVYVEFVEQELGVAANSLSAINLQDRLSNVLVLRSLSKAFGLAGLRVGYLVVPEPLAARFDAVRLPLSVAGPSVELALDALSDAGAARAARAEALVARGRLAATLGGLGCRVLPSVTNFVSFLPRDADALAEALVARGIILRRYESGPMAGWLRATARIGDEGDRFIQALEELLP